MTLYIRAKTNRTDIPPMINAAKIKLTSGNVLTIDRDRTEYKYVNGYLEMEWRGVYLCEVNGIHFIDGTPYLNGETEVIDYLNANMRTCKLDIEDDAPENYEIILKGYFFY